MGKEWDANRIGRVFGIIDEALYSMALYSEINPSNRDNAIQDLRYLFGYEDDAWEEFLSLAHTPQGKWICVACGQP